jgi:hypothetical protein
MDEGISQIQNHPGVVDGIDGRWLDVGVDVTMWRIIADVTCCATAKNLLLFCEKR